MHLSRVLSIKVAWFRKPLQLTLFCCSGQSTVETVFYDHRVLRSPVICSYNFMHNIGIHIKTDPVLWPLVLNNQNYWNQRVVINWWTTLIPACFTMTLVPQYFLNLHRFDMETAVAYKYEHLLFVSTNDFHFTIIRKQPTSQEHGHLNLVLHLICNVKSVLFY